jgi:hypothetical protein
MVLVWHGGTEDKCTDQGDRAVVGIVGDGCKFCRDRNSEKKERDFESENRSKNRGVKHKKLWECALPDNVMVSAHKSKGILFERLGTSRGAPARIKLLLMSMFLSNRERWRGVF